MKKVNVFLMAALIAASAMCVVSCESDPSDEPTIKITFGNHVQDENDKHPTTEVGSAQERIPTLAVHLEFNAPGGLKEVRIRQTAPTSEAGDYGDYPIESGFSDGKNLHKVTINVTRPEGNAAYTATYLLDVFDNDKVMQKESKQFTVTFPAFNPTTPLSTTPTPFTWSRSGSNPAVGVPATEPAPSAFGIDWFAHDGNAGRIHIRTLDNTVNKVVKLEVADWTGITTKEALKDIVEEKNDIGTLNNEIRFQVSSNTPPTPRPQDPVLIFGTRVGTGENAVYYMIQVTQTTDNGDGLRTIGGNSKQ